MNEVSRTSSVDQTTLHPKTLTGFIWANRRRFLPGLCFALGRILAICTFPLVFRDIIDHRMPAREQGAILWLALLMVVLNLLHYRLMVRGASLLGQAVTSMTMHLRGQIFEKIQFLNLSYLDRQKTGRLLAKYAFDTQKIEGVVQPILNSFIPDSLYSLLTFIILTSINWRLSCVIILMLPIIAIMRTKFFARLQETHKESRTAQEQLAGTATEFLGALRLVRSYGEEERVQTRMDQTSDYVARSRVDLIRVSSGFGAFSWGSIQLLSLIIVAGGALLAIHGHVTSGTVLAFVAGIGPLVQPIQMFANLSDQYFLGREAYNSVRELLDERDIENWGGAKTLNPIRGRVEFDHVGFTYAGADRPAINDFSLTIEPGEKIALVGSSGAGKSTVTNLLLGLYPPTSGQIRIDGVPQGELDMRWLRRHTAIVMQESVLLSGSVEDNIRFAAEHASDVDVREAARRAQALEFIERMPEGFKTTVGERGVMLSGGQRQRLSIARALLRNPALLILDEPTSALDYESERLIQTALDILVKGRTVITIAHRLSTIRNADRVVVMSEGKIMEIGSFDELWKMKGRFHEMLTAQGGFETQEFMPEEPGERRAS